MEKEMSFHILGIEETKDENAVKMAYRKLLKETNPEDDPEDFKRLRTAYETAAAFAAKPDDETEPENGGGTEKRLRLTRGSTGSTSATAMYTTAPMSRRGGSFWRIRSVTVWIRRWRPESGFWPI